MAEKASIEDVNSQLADTMQQIGELEENKATKAEVQDIANDLEANYARKDEVTNGLTPKGAIAYASLPTTGNQIGDYYYCPDGDGVNGSGNYVWNGTVWYFGGTGDEGYNILKEDLGGFKWSYVRYLQDGVVNTNHYRTFKELDPNKMYAFVITPSATNDYTLQIGTITSADSMVETLLSGVRINENEEYKIFGYTPSVSGLRVLRLSGKVPWALKVYEVLASNYMMDIVKDVTYVKNRLNNFTITEDVITANNQYLIKKTQE